MKSFVESTICHYIYTFKRTMLRNMSRIIAGENVRMGVRICNTWMTLRQIEEIVEREGGWFLKCSGEVPQEDCTLEVDLQKLRSHEDYPEFPHDEYMNLVKYNITQGLKL